MRPYRLVHAILIAILAAFYSIPAMAHCGKSHPGGEDPVAHCGDCGDENAVAGCGHCDKEEGCGGCGHGSEEGCGGCGNCGHHKAQQASFGSGAASAPAEFKATAGKLVAAYLDLQEALAGDDLAKANESVKKAGEALGKVDAHEVSEWNETSKPIRDALEKMKGADSLDALRKPFGDLSKSLIGVIHRWGVLEESGRYMAYCPMALDGKGGHWLQRDKEVANPYFGSSMLRCGEIEAIN